MTPAQARHAAEPVEYTSARGMPRRLRHVRYEGAVWQCAPARVRVAADGLALLVAAQRGLLLICRHRFQHVQRRLDGALLADAAQVQHLCGIVDVRFEVPCPALLAGVVRAAGAEHLAGLELAVAHWAGHLQCASVCRWDQVLLHLC